MSILKDSLLKAFRGKYILAVSVVLLSFLLGNIVQAVSTQTAEPGSDADPLVTQGYVDKKIGDLSSLLERANQAGDMNDLAAQVNTLSQEKSNLEKKVNELTGTIAALTKKLDEITQGESDTGTQGQQSSPAPKFVLVKLSKGKQLLTASSTEVIPISGQMKPLKGKVGIMLDITTGLDTKTTVNVSVKHLLFSSSEDGRGLKASTDASMLVKGKYTIK